MGSEDAAFVIDPSLFNNSSAFLNMLFNVEDGIMSTGIFKASAVIGRCLCTFSYWLLLLLATFTCMGRSSSLFAGFTVFDIPISVKNLDTRASLSRSDLAIQYSYGI